MIGVLIQLIIWLIVVGVIYWAFTQLIGLVPLPAPIGQIIHVLLVIILVFIVLYAVLQVLGAVGVGGGMPHFSIR